MPARIEDVAAHAGVSTKTVSRVLNGHTSVRAKLRARIEASIRELNYVPNASARSLAGNRSYLVALLYDNPTAVSSYIMELIVGVLQACKGTPYNAVLHPFDAADDLAARIDGFVAQHRPDALVLVPPHANNAKLLQRLDELDIRYSTISSKLRESCIDIGFDERKAAADIVEHLVSLGHRRIGHVTGLKGHGARTWRLSGYRDALRKAGIAYDESLVVDGDFTFASGVAAAKSCWIDAAAHGDLCGERRHGLRRDTRSLRTRADHSRRSIGMRLRRHAGIAADLARPDDGAPALPRDRMPGGRKRIAVDPRSGHAPAVARALPGATTRIYGGTRKP